MRLEQALVKNAGCSGGLNDDSENPETGVYFSISDPCKLRMVPQILTHR